MNVKKRVLLVELMMGKKGFTLIELMIVVAIIAIIAAIAIPGLMRARISANEGSASAGLRTLATSQTQFQEQAQVDQNANGSGEFGLLGELAGACNRRNGVGNARREVCNPTFLTPAIGPNGGAGTNTGTKSGYLYQIFLPGTIANIGETDNGTVGQDGLDPVANGDEIDAQETRFRAFAWPLTRGSTGNRCFSVDQSGEVLAADGLGVAGNASLGYSGLIVIANFTRPAFNAAVDCAGSVGGSDTEANFSGTYKAKVEAMDNQIWTAAGG